MTFLDAIGYEPTQTPLQVILIRLTIAAILGGVIGFEREQSRHRAGLRTHILIAVAAALYTTLALEIFHLSPTTEGRTDPIRAIEAVTAGIAFLGAGAIFQQRGSVHGLTTGAGMWLAGAVGASTALGLYVIAVAAALLAVVVLALQRVLERRPDGVPDRDGRSE